MTSSLVRRACLAAFIIVASVSGCKCGSKVNSTGCQSDSDCQAENGGNTRWYCDTTQNPAACALHPKQCDTAADCCPAQICNAQGHYCFDKYDTCTQSGDCPVNGEVCQEIGVFAKGLGCTWPKPDATGNCAAGTSPFNGYCVATAPCNGGCTSTTNPVCITATNKCSPAPAASSCKQTCPSGQILVLQDPANIFDTCNETTEVCICTALPPIQTHDTARYSSMTSSGQDLYVSAYDGEHGDLVVHTFDKNDLTKPVKSEWLDGVPASGHIGGDPNGPRGGITDNGPNVGMYTSIVSDAQGDLYVSYYDVDNGDLKFIARYGTTWTQPMTVDGSTPTGTAPTNGDLGLYSSIALDNTGTPAIAYFRRGSYDPASGTETGLQTGLVYAVAKRTQPLTAADWTVVGDIDSASGSRKPCGGACSQGQQCVVDSTQGAGDICGTTSSGCTPACSGKQVCTTTPTDSTAVCRTSEAALGLNDLPFGTGLTPSLAFVDAHPVIAYYENLASQDAQGNLTYKRALKAVLGTGNGASPSFGAPVVIDGEDVNGLTRDTGRWPSVAVGPSGTTGGRIAIAFGDLTTQQLLVYQSDTLTGHAAHVADGQQGLIHVIDNGQPASGAAFHPQSFPGVQASAAFTASGQIAIAYQDAQPVDLLFAKYSPTSFKVVAPPTTIRSTGAAGFWPRMQIVSGTAYVSSATIKAAAANLPANKLNIDVTGGVN